jgi:uncharacterized alpha-E superfamily protein
MARYIERAENIARFIDVTLNVILDHSVDEQWEPLILATGDQEYFKEQYADITPENVRHFLTFDLDYNSSIISSLNFARENARTVREAISSEAWESLNDFYWLVKRASQGAIKDSTFDVYSEIRRQSHLFSGIFDATMSRDKGWYFANIGRFIERADKTSRILDVKYFTLLPTVTSIGTTPDDLLWSAVLRSVGGFEMFRKRFHSLTIERVVDFLVLDTRFPRAIRYCTQTVASSLRQVGQLDSLKSNPAIANVDQLNERLAAASNREIIDGGLHEFIDSIQTSLNELGAAIHETYFASRQHYAESQAQSQSQS